MVRVRHNRGWSRRGFSLLWGWEMLASLCPPTAVVSMRDLFRLAQDWPEDLPAASGDGLIVAGMEGCLDVLAQDDAHRWIERDLKDAILSFQDHYEGQAGLIFWLPSGSKRLNMSGASERYFWTHKPSGPEGLPIGQLLFAGAEVEVERLMATDDKKADYDGKDWIGLHHPRIS